MYVLYFQVYSETHRSTNFFTYKYYDTILELFYEYLPALYKLHPPRAHNLEKCSFTQEEALGPLSSRTQSYTEQYHTTRKPFKMLVHTANQSSFAKQKQKHTSIVQYIFPKICWFMCRQQQTVVRSKILQTQDFPKKTRWCTSRRDISTQQQSGVPKKTQTTRLCNPTVLDQIMPPQKNTRALQKNY